MIQRIQSIWLLLAAACAFAGFKFSYYSGTNAKGLSPYELNANQNFFLMLTTIAVGGLALITIFLFKKRNLQLRLCFLGILLETVLIFLYYRVSRHDGFKPSDGFTIAILHSIIVLAFVLAARAINKDSKMVKNSDRLR